MSDKLHFNLVSPERELFSGEVDQVVVPGTEGDFGVLPNHAPVMSAVRTGTITVIDAAAERRIFVRGGFADVTPDGLTILAEEAAPIDDFETADVDQKLQDAREDLGDATTDDVRAIAQAAVEKYEIIRDAMAAA